MLYVVGDRIGLGSSRRKFIEKWTRKFGAEILGTLDFILSMLSSECVKSALHGLGHMQQLEPTKVAIIIDNFLEIHLPIDPEIMKFALECRRGFVW